MKNRTLKLIVSLVMLAAWGGCFSSPYKNGMQVYKKKLSNSESIIVKSSKTINRNSKPNDVSNLEKLVDNNPDTPWCFFYSKDERFAYEMEEDDVTLMVKFDPPVYLESLEIVNGNSSMSGEQEGMVKNLYIERKFMPEETYPLGDLYELQQSSMQQNLNLNRKNEYSWKKMFRTDRLVIHAFDLYDDTDKACISEIGFKYSRKLEYVPSLSWRDLEKKILAGISYHKNTNKWDAETTLSNRRLFEDFVYYVLAGNSEARKYFDSYEPYNTDLSEMLTNVWRPLIDAELTKTNNY